MIAPNTHPKIVIAGLGNLLMADDGVGVHAVRLLRQDPPENVLIADVGTAALHAQDLFEQADMVIAIDAVQAGGKAGSVYRFDLDDAQTQSFHSLHDLGLAGVLKLMPESKRPHVIVVGVEPETIDYRMELSPAVQAALPKVVQLVGEMIKRITKTPGTNQQHKQKRYTAREMLK